MDEIVAVLTKHFEPTRSVIAECFHFRRRSQTANETIAEYVAALRRAALYCDFGAFLEDALRDRLVGGLRNEAMQKRLLSEKNLTLNKAVELDRVSNLPTVTLARSKAMILPSIDLVVVMEDGHSRALDVARLTILPQNAVLRMLNVMLVARKVT